jgi:hypothetical protein
LTWDSANLERMKNLMALLPILFFSLYAQARDLDCQPVDYRSQLGAIRDQGNNNWCYGYTAADMLTQRLRVENPEKFKDLQVSALDMTFQFYNGLTPDPESPKFPGFWSGRIYNRALIDANTKRQEKILHPYFDLHDSGYIDKALQIYAFTNPGICWEKDLPATHGLTLDLVNEVNALYSALAAQYPNGNLENDDLNKLRNLSWSRMIEKHCGVRTSVALKTTVITFDALMTWQIKNADGSFHFYYDDPSRRSGEDNPPAEATSYIRSRLFSNINQGLDLGRIVGIDYSPKLFRPPGVEDAELHASSIVARQESGGQCRYLIRNSWGSDCGKYNEKFKTRCSEGEIWVTQDELAPFLIRAHFIQ